MKRSTFAFLIWFAAAIPASATTYYYVSSTSGVDTNSGVAAEHAWKTIARVNRARLQPGDMVLFQRGNIWRETLRPSSSGDQGKVITFGAYGKGPRPVISGSDLVASQNHGSVEKELSTRSPPVEVHAREVNIDNNEQSHIVYDNLDLQHAQEGLRLYSWSAQVSDITLQDSRIATESRVPHGTVSAGVYASVNRGHFSEVTIRNNTFIPYPTGLEHWGVYFVQGVTDFRITGNTFSPAGEDAITVWHCARGVIAENSGGGNGENTVDVKDSPDIEISDNRADRDREYNIVVHDVDAGSLTTRIVVRGNHCTRGGQGGQLTAGIVLLFVRDSEVRDNVIENAYGAGIFVNDRGTGSGNSILHNLLRNNGTHQTTGAITLEDAADIEVRNNTVDHQLLGGFALRIEGGSQTSRIKVSENRFFPGNGNMLDVTQPGKVLIAADQNEYYAREANVFHWGSRRYSFVGWQTVIHQDAHSRLVRADLLPGHELSSHAKPQQGTAALMTGRMSHRGKVG
jgi:hypothetical protein